MSSTARSRDFEGKADYYIQIIPVVEEYPATIHQKRKNNEVFYETGLGCKDWSNCFTCPFPPDDCHFSKVGRPKKGVTE